MQQKIKISTTATDVAMQTKVKSHNIIEKLCSCERVCAKHEKVCFQSEVCSMHRSRLESRADLFTWNKDKGR